MNTSQQFIYIAARHTDNIMYADEINRRPCLKLKEKYTNYLAE